MVPSAWTAMFAFGRPPSGSGLRLCAAKGAGVKFRRLYAVTVCSGDLGPTTKKSAVDPRLDGGTGCPHGLVKTIVTTGWSPTRKNAPFTGVDTVTEALRPPGWRQIDPPSPPGPGRPASPGVPSAPRSPRHPVPSAMTPAPSSDSANLIAVPPALRNRPPLAWDCTPPPLGEDAVLHGPKGLLGVRPRVARTPAVTEGPDYGNGLQVTQLLRARLATRS